jgi:hypothetical protein
MPPSFNYTGVVPILATPFHDDESLDLDSLARLIEGIPSHSLTLAATLSRAIPPPKRGRCPVGPGHPIP